MSDLNNEIDTPEEPDQIEEKGSSATMLITLLLLISGFLLTGTMLLHYAAKKGGGDSVGKASPFNMTALLEKGKTFKAKLDQPREAKSMTIDSEEDPNGGNLGKLFSARTEKVRWPKLKLTGMGSSSGGEGGFAIINGDQIHPGELIDGKVMLVEVHSFDVIVEYMGEKRTLTVGVEN